MTSRTATSLTIHTSSEILLTRGEKAGFMQQDAAHLSIALRPDLDAEVHHRFTYLIPIQHCCSSAIFESFHRISATIGLSHLSITRAPQQQRTN